MGRVSGFDLEVFWGILVCLLLAVFKCGSPGQEGLV
jgi:hypothetical protein